MARQRTEKQEIYKNLRMKGVIPTDAYRQAYNTNASPANISKAAQKLEIHPLIAPLLVSLREEAAENALCDAEWVVKGLMKEAIDKDNGSTGTSRVAAYKALSGFTGGFDKNKQKVDIGEKIVTIIDLTGSDNAD
ncbi:MAG: hypothetical protein V3V84_07880 [Candidatus Bathyarchaeia archaeon]